MLSAIWSRVLEFASEQAPLVRVFSTHYIGETRVRGPDIVDKLRVILGWEDVPASLTFSCNSKPIHSLLRAFGAENTLEVDFGSRTGVVRRGKLVSYNDRQDDHMIRSVKAISEVSVSQSAILP